MLNLLLLLSLLFSSKHDCGQKSAYICQACYIDLAACDGAMSHGCSFIVWQMGLSASLRYRYVPVHLWFFALFGTFAVLPAAYATAVWIGGSTIYYLSTVFGEPEHTGDAPIPSGPPQCICTVSQAAPVEFCFAALNAGGTSAIVRVALYSCIGITLFVVCWSPEVEMQDWTA